MDYGNKQSSLVRKNHNMLAASYSTMTQLSSQCSAHQLLHGANIKLMEDHTGARLNLSAAHLSEVNLDLNANKPNKPPLDNLLHQLHLVTPSHPNPFPKLSAKTSNNTTLFSPTTLIKTPSMLIQTTPKTSSSLETP